MISKLSGMVFALAAAVSVALPDMAWAQAPGALPPIKAVTTVRRTAPVYPLDLLLKGRTGQAEVRFMVDHSGRPVMTTVASASQPQFGHALLADIESNEFMPERINGQPQLTLTGLRHSFDGEASLQPGEKRILAELKKIVPALVPSRELDKPLVQTRKDAPVFPYALQSDGVSGRAEIEFVVDRDGVAMLPRILNASHEDFGWAAATAVQRWRYQPPLKGGQKVDTRTIVTFQFDHTKGTVTW